MSNREDLIKTYRTQLQLKSDIIKGKNDEIKKINYNNKIQLEKIKKDNDKKINELKESHCEELETLKNTYNKMIYTSERKHKKLEKKQDSYLYFWY